MSTKSKMRTDSAEAAARPSREHRSDLYGWVEDQVALLKAGRVSEIDAANVADELGDVGKSEFDKLRSAVGIVLMHLLKWDHQPTHRSRSWVVSIRQHRRQISRVLGENPSLKPRIDQAVTEAYEDAVDEAMKETGLVEATFPETCPYDWQEIIDRVIERDDLQSPRRR